LPIVCEQTHEYENGGDEEQNKSNKVDGRAVDAITPIASLSVLLLKPLLRVSIRHLRTILFL
jgi:hypothetical protein